MRTQIANIFKGMSSILNFYPSWSDLPVELQRFATPPRNVEEAFAADMNSLGRDWAKVGKSLQHAMAGVNHGRSQQ